MGMSGRRKVPQMFKMGSWELRMGFNGGMEDVGRSGWRRDPPVEEGSTNSHAWFGLSPRKLGLASWLKHCAYVECRNGSKHMLKGEYGRTVKW